MRGDLDDVDTLRAAMRGASVVYHVAADVRIVTPDCRTGTARRAEYHDLEQRVVLVGDARVWQDDNVVSGETITMYLAQDRSVVQAGKQDRVKAVFHPRDDKADKARSAAKDGTPEAGTRPAAAPCVN